MLRLPIPFPCVASRLSRFAHVCLKRGHRDRREYSVNAVLRNTLQIYCTTEKKRMSRHQWISAFFGQNLHDSGKYCVCFLVIEFVYVPPFILRLHYVPGGPFARNVACRGVLVIHFSDFQDLRFFYVFYVFLRCITISVTSRGSDKPMCHGCAKVRYGYPRSVKVSYGRNLDTIRYKAQCFLLYTNKSFEIITIALLNNRLQID